jgi:hypothetical protein
MNTELLIEMYQIDSESFIKELNISNYNLNKINEICPPEDPFDIDYCNGLFIEQENFKNLKLYINTNFKISSTKLYNVKTK